MRFSAWWVGWCAAACACGGSSAGDGSGEASTVGEDGSSGSASSGSASSGGADGTAGTDTGGVSGGRWLWQSDVASGDELDAVWGSAPDDVWAGGHSGGLVHWDGAAWSTVDSATVSHIGGIWGAAADDVWAVAGGIGGAGAANLVHWDGNAWSAVDAGTPDNLHGIWGSAADDVWAVGGSGVEGVIVHYDGAAWSSFMTSPTYSLRAVAGSGPADVWAVGGRFGPFDGNDESILHFAAAGAWTPVSSAAPGKELLAVWSADGGSAWAMGGVDALVHWDGGSWSAFADPSPDGVRAMWGSDPTRITAVGTNANILEGDGSSWSLRVQGGATLLAAAGLDEEHRWAVGENGTIFTFEAEVTDAPDCVDIGGTCGDEAACPTGQGHLSDYACDDAAASVCCVSANACGGFDAVCCTPKGGEVRAICHNGAYVCPAGSDECPPPPP
jgi:hypothetical protein